VGDDQVRDPQVERDAVQRRVGLDHPAVGLRGEPGDDRMAGLD
jgi:hypothetical protein